MGFTLFGMGGMWGDSYLNETFELQNNNLNGSTHNEKGGIIFGLGPAFILPFSLNAALIGEANFWWGGNEFLVDDSTAGLPKGSSDYVSFRGANIPLLLQLSTSGEENVALYVEGGAQANFIYAYNRDKQNSSLFDYGFIVGAGIGIRNENGAENVGLVLRFSFGYNTCMLMLRLFGGGGLQ
jgi:hypothetical protein